jgi:uncharacterized protein YggE
MNRFFQPTWLKGLSLIFLSGLIFILGGSLLNNGLTPTALAQNSSARSLTVTGQGTESIATTLTEVRLGVEVEGATASQVQEEVARRSSAVVELLRSRNVEKLETTGIRLQPQYNYNDGQRRLRGYQAVNLVSFRIPTEDVGNLLDEAVQAGATRIDAVSFTATDSAIAQAQKEALRSATLDAKAQAEAVLGALNLRSEAVINIQINNANPPIMPRAETFRTQAETAASSAPSSPVVGGEQEIEARVTLQIRY